MAVTRASGMVGMFSHRFGHFVLTHQSTYYDLCTCQYILHCNQKVFFFVVCFKARNPLLQCKGRHYRRIAGTTAITEKAILRRKATEYCIALSKCHNMASVCSSPRGNNSRCLNWLLWTLNGMVHVKSFAQKQAHSQEWRGYLLLFVWGHALHSRPARPLDCSLRYTILNRTPCAAIQGLHGNKLSTFILGAGQILKHPYPKALKENHWKKEAPQPHAHHREPRTSPQYLHGDEIKQMKDQGPGPDQDRDRDPDQDPQPQLLPLHQALLHPTPFSGNLQVKAGRCPSSLRQSASLLPPPIGEPARITTPNQSSTYWGSPSTHACTGRLRGRFGPRH